MKSLFVIHASIWDMLLLVLGVGFAVFYLVLWLLASRGDKK